MSTADHAKTQPISGLSAALVFLVALNLRPAITGIGPIMSTVGESTGLGSSALGWLSSIPLLAFAAISPIVYRPARRFGIDRVVFVSLVVLAVGIAMRSYLGTAGLWAGTLVLGIAIGVGNVLVPVMTKRDYPTRVSGATGIFSACISVGAAAAAFAAVPIAKARGWEDALAVWAIPALLVAVLMVPRALRPPVDAIGEDVAPAAASGPADSVWRRPQAWLITLFMGFQSMSFYTVVTWWATIEKDGGLSDDRAGLHMTLLQLIGILGSLLMPTLMKRCASGPIPALVASVPMILAPVGLMAAPSLGMLWIVIAGLAQGAALVVAMSLISMAGRDENDTTQISGMAQSVGYLLAAIGPIAVGTLAERTGNWGSALIVIAVIAAVQLVVGILASRTLRV